MPIDWTPFVDLVRRHQSFLLTTHVRPDGDGLGSMLGLGETLERMGKKVRIVIASPLPPRYDFLNADGRIKQFQPPGDDLRSVDAVVVMDTGTWGQLGDFGPFLKSLNVDKMVIDHHLTQDDLGGPGLVDTSAEAAGRLSWEAIGALGQPLTPTSASALLAALAMDTGWFRHSNTTSATFALAADLVKAGARPEILYDALFERNTLGRLKLMGLALSRLQVEAGGKIAFTEILKDDYEATGAIPADTEDLVNFPRSIVGVEVGLLFMEQLRGGIKVSFRARGKVNVGQVAEQFGGGGHRLASGATLNVALGEARARVLEAVQEKLSTLGD